MMSLQKSIRTCKVDTSYANKMESDRFFNEDNLVCPSWNGKDTTGRMVHPNSFNTKSRGCNSAQDRILVENCLRPQYTEYVNLNSYGIDGHLYGNQQSNGAANKQTAPSANIRNVHNYTGNFGTNFGSHVYPSCTAKKGMTNGVNVNTGDIYSVGHTDCKYSCGGCKSCN